tara:strand:+ start:502 stop:651 length:150 start_codon:yes stop_codon:yes gene_type:complete
MSKFLVTYKVYYEIQVEANDEREAQDIALGHPLEDFHDLTITGIKEVVE